MYVQFYWNRLTMTDLSPEAQAVVNAAEEVTGYGKATARMKYQLAASILAAVEQTQQRQYGERFICDANKLLSIATELQQENSTHSVLNNWYPIKTAPRDGTMFIGANSSEMIICNWPRGCAIGRWSRNSKRDEWDGYSIPTLYRLTHWHKAPEFPPFEPVSNL